MSVISNNSIGNDRVWLYQGTTFSRILADIFNEAIEIVRTI